MGLFDYDDGDYYDDGYYYPDSYGDVDARSDDDGHDVFADYYPDDDFDDGHYGYYDFQMDHDEAIEALFVSMTPCVRRKAKARLIPLGKWWQYWKRGLRQKKETLRSHRDAHSVRKSKRKNFKVKHQRFGRVIALNIGEGTRVWAHDYAYMGLVF